MPTRELLEKLWKDYAAMNKQAGVIHKALEARGEKVINDHVAFRTFNHPKVNIDVMAAPFLQCGYQFKGGEGYQFPEKKLFARHLEHPNPDNPKIFISELKIQECSAPLQKVLNDLIAQVPQEKTKNEDFLISGVLWKPVSWKIYQDLLKESEYAAWMAVFGFRVNHFTVFFNSLKTFKNLAELNVFIKGLGFEMNTVGGEVKGSKEVFLEQSSTLAHPVETVFADRKEIIPACYYEFAKRYPQADGKLFQGFIPDSASKIFDSTNYRPGQSM